jgi:DNA repair protein RecO
MRQFQSRGLILASHPHLHKGYVLKIFTSQQGSISAYLQSQKHLDPLLCSPLCEAEWLLQDSYDRDLFYVREATIITPFLAIRQHLSSLQWAGKLLQIILTTQLPQKPSSPLYALTIHYLRHLYPETPHPSWFSSFLLKLLKWEGLLHHPLHCTVCQAPSRAILPGESYCLSHAPPFSFRFHHVEESLLEKLLFIKNLKDLPPIPHGQEVLREIEALQSYATRM